MREEGPATIPNLNYLRLGVVIATRMMGQESKERAGSLRIVVVAHQQMNRDSLADELSQGGHQPIDENAGVTILLLGQVAKNHQRVEADAPQPLTQEVPTIGVVWPVGQVQIRSK